MAGTSLGSLALLQLACLRDSSKGLGAAPQPIPKDITRAMGLSQGAFNGQDQGRDEEVIAGRPRFKRRYAIEDLRLAVHWAAKSVEQP